MKRFLLFRSDQVKVRKEEHILKVQHSAAQQFLQVDSMAIDTINMLRFL